LSSTTALVIAAFLAGAVVLGIQSGINVVGAMIYPTSLRANGSGWQLGLGRFGAIIGPLAGTLLVAFPIEKMYLFAAVPFALGAVVTFIIHVLNQKRLRERPELQDAQ
jgi:AAHS family 4-hydroxybenzoate transporter-like MFS transporter